MNPIDEHDDDIPVGRLLSRRDALALLGGLGAMLLVGCDAPAQSSSTPVATLAPATPTAGSAAAAATATTAPVVSVATQPPATQAVAAATATTAPTSVAALPSCVVRPELTEGPYFVDEMINRSDIRTNPSDGVMKEGVPLKLTFLVSRVGTNTCAPLTGAQIDVWHCDAAGVYSDVNDPGFSTKGQKFLRGYQQTDANGTATFTTIYPGWYQGRTVHIHFKIRTNPGATSGHEFTSQLFFDNSLSDKVYTQQPYAQKGQRTLRNEGDGIYQQSGGQLQLQLTEDGQGGYNATFNVGMQIA